MSIKIPYFIMYDGDTGYLYDCLEAAHTEAWVEIRVIKKIQYCSYKWGIGLNFSEIVLQK